MLSFIHKKCQGINTHDVLSGKLLSLGYAKSITILLMRAGVKQSIWEEASGVTQQRSKICKSGS